VLHHARQAQTANRLAPRQTRSAVGTAAIRGKYDPIVSFWLHPDGAPAASGTAVAAVRDYGLQNVSITQATASKQPLLSVRANLPCFTFDGVNDALQVAAIDFSGTQQLTIAIVEFRATTTGGTEWELTTNQNLNNNGIGIFANDFGTNRWEIAFLGNVGYQVKEVSTTAQRWQTFVATINKGAAAASELALFQNGVKLSSFTTLTTSENTNTFANSASWIGSRNNGTAYPFSGSIAQLVVIRSALTDSQAAALSLEIAQAAGFA